MKLAALTATMIVHVIRLHPGDDVKLKLEEFVRERKLEAALIVSAVGSLTDAELRYAAQDKTEKLKGPFEVVSLVGTLSASGGSHVHMSISDKSGKTLGGHLMPGNKVYTTLEVGIGELKGKAFKREHDPKSGYEELKI